MSFFKQLWKAMLKDESKSQEAIVEAYPENNESPSLQHTLGYDEMIKFMQDNKVDSIGIGAYVRNSMSYASWKKLDWYEEYAHLTVKCKVDLNIINSGQIL